MAAFKVDLSTHDSNDDDEIMDSKRFNLMTLATDSKCARINAIWPKRFDRSICW
jgi:hypothetical protein